MAGVLAVLSLPGTAQSAFPGTNGKIVFASDRDGALDVYAMAPDGSSQTRLTDVDRDDVYPMWSADGTQIVFSSWREGNSKIFRMNADSSAQTRLTNTAIYTDEEPSLSRLGDKIVFRSNREFGLQIWMMNADGTGVQRLTGPVSPGGTDESLTAVWSPTTDTIAFASNRDGDYEIYTLDVSTSVVTQITFNTGFDSNPDWSPDGTKLTYQSNVDGDFDVYVLDLSAGPSFVPEQRTDDPAFDSAPTWSPDGTKLAFQSNRDGDFEIFTMNADGTNVVQLTQSDGFDRVADWQPRIAGVDATAPVLKLPGDVVTHATSPGGATVSFIAYAIDDVDAAPIVSCSPASGSAFPVGTTTVSCTATDSAGNGSSGSFDVTVALPNTLVGSGVVVTPPDGAGNTPITITFAEVMGEGITTLSTSSAGPTPPEGFEVAGVYYELATTAQFDEAEVCFAIAPPSAPTIAHWLGNPPAPSILGTYYRDAIGGIVGAGEGTLACAVVTSFSPFALVRPAGGGDTTAPALSLPGGIVVDATSPAGAVVAFTASATDDVDPNPLVVCSPASGATFAVGTTSVACTATDAAGNVSTGSFSVTVRGATEQLDRLIQKVVDSSNLSPALKTQLTARLKALVAGFDPANARQRQAVCGALNVFKTLVQALSGRGIPPARAAEWIADANRIRTVLGC